MVTMIFAEATEAAHSVAFVLIHQQQHQSVESADEHVHPIFAEQADQDITTAHQVFHVSITNQHLNQAKI